MRIDAYNQVAQLYGIQKNLKTQKAQNAAGPRDQVSISQAGRDYQVAKSAVSEASDIREDKVALMKERIASGEYNVSADELAQKLAAKYNTTVY